jgi:hypothetical protein
MRASRIGLAAAGLLFVAVYACGGRLAGDDIGVDSGAGSPSIGESSGDASASSSGSAGSSGGFGSSASSGAPGSSSGGPPSLPALGTVIAADCMACTFPPPTAPACAPSVPPIELVYPPDNVLVPPNMNVISVQWTPSGTPFLLFEVVFSNATSSTPTDWRIVTSCKNQTIDSQRGLPSGGCEVLVDPVSWSRLVGANRGAGPVTITVRGTTDGNCASTSANAVNLSFAEDDFDYGTYYYWKSAVSLNGVGGQIWAQRFGDVSTTEKDVTSAATRGATCSGCHVLSRDGSRMVVYSDDDDSDDEYSDIAGTLLDMSAMPIPIPLGPAVAGTRARGQPPGFSAFEPLANVYVTSNGLALTAVGAAPSTTSAGYPSAVSANGWSVWNGRDGTFIRGVTIGAEGTRPTMPDWSADGRSVVYVQPAAVGTLRPDGGAASAGAPNDDSHVFGGSLYRVSYVSIGTFDRRTPLLQSSGENNYYPSYSPDVPTSFVVFDRAPLDMSAGSLTGCGHGLCPNDSFSNPAARLMLTANAPGSTAIDLEQANGSPSAAPVPLSNSYPRWAPFVHSYRGRKLLWITFSSTRDYGIRVLNHKPGMHPCYPADAPQMPGAPRGQPFAPECQQPQLWMAAIHADAPTGADPSEPAFWIPYQDPTTHNHTAQWTHQAHTRPPPPSCMCSMLFGPCAPANPCGCCQGYGFYCSNGLCDNTGLQ